MQSAFVCIPKVPSMKCTLLQSFCRDVVGMCCALGFLAGCYRMHERPVDAGTDADTILVDGMLMHIEPWCGPPDAPQFPADSIVGFSSGSDPTQLMQVDAAGHATALARLWPIDSPQLLSVSPDGNAVQVRTGTASGLPAMTMIVDLKTGGVVNAVDAATTAVESLHIKCPVATYPWAFDGRSVIVQCSSQDTHGVTISRAVQVHRDGRPGRIIDNRCSTAVPFTGSCRAVVDTSCSTPNMPNESALHPLYVADISDSPSSMHLSNARYDNTAAASGARLVGGAINDVFVMTINASSAAKVTQYDANSSAVGMSYGVDHSVPANVHGLVVAPRDGSFFAASVAGGVVVGDALLDQGHASSAAISQHDGCTTAHWNNDGTRLALSCSDKVELLVNTDVAQLAPWHRSPFGQPAPNALSWNRASTRLRARGTTFDQVLETAHWRIVSVAGASQLNSDWLWR